MKANWKVALLGSGAAVALMAATPAFADDIGDLRSQISKMQDKIAKLEADRAQKRRVAAAAAVEAGDKPRSWKLPGTNTSMQIGGYTKADFYYTMNGNNGLTYTAAGASQRGTNGGRLTENTFQFHARQSRFWIKTWTPTDWGELGTHIEGDFFGAGNSTWRLRHAYGYLGPVLAGQTWNIYNPLFAGAETLDFGGPVGVPSIPRTTQVRYTHSFGQGTTLIVGLNTVGDTVLTPVAGAGRQKMPDFEWSLHHNFSGGRIWIGGVLGQVEFEPTAAGTSGFHAKFKWGVGVAAAYRVGKFAIGGQWHIGEGIGGAYLTGSGASAVVDINAAGNASLNTVLTTGGAMFIQYKITDTIRTNIAYGYVWSDVGADITGGKNGLGQANGQVENAHSIFVNLIWSPVPQVNFGIEYQHGFTARYNSGNGYWDRIHVAMQYSF